jgi:hypothetical protein
MVVSLVRGEFLPSRPKALLLVALSLALFTFACLSFGETTTGQLSGTAGELGHRPALSALERRLRRGLPSRAPRV